MPELTAVEESIKVRTLKDIYDSLEDETPEWSRLREGEYRRGFRDGWIQAANLMFDVWFMKKKQVIYDLFFDHWMTELDEWMSRSDSGLEPPPVIPVGAKCVYCGNMAQHLDHWVPRSEGGINRFDNLVPACRRCNLQKSVRDPYDFLRMILDKVPVEQILYLRDRDFIYLWSFELMMDGDSWTEGELLARPHICIDGKYYSVIKAVKDWEHEG
jgi:5-methylcytosine-specific restriction endonuclease McrA